MSFKLPVASKNAFLMGGGEYICRVFAVSVSLHILIALILFRKNTTKFANQAYCKCGFAIKVRKKTLRIRLHGPVLCLNTDGTGIWLFLLCCVKILP